MSRTRRSAPSDRTAASILRALQLVEAYHKITPNQEIEMPKTVLNSVATHHPVRQSTTHPQSTCSAIFAKLHCIDSAELNLRDIVINVIIIIINM